MKTSKTNNNDALGQEINDMFSKLSGGSRAFPSMRDSRNNQDMRTKIDKMVQRYDGGSVNKPYTSISCIK